MHWSEQFVSSSQPVTLTIQNFSLPHSFILFPLPIGFSSFQLSLSLFNLTKATSSVISLPFPPTFLSLSSLIGLSFSCLASFKRDMVGRFNEVRIQCQAFVVYQAMSMLISISQMETPQLIQKIGLRAQFDEYPIALSLDLWWSTSNSLFCLQHHCVWKSPHSTISQTAYPSVIFLHCQCHLQHLQLSLQGLHPLQSFIGTHPQHFKA